MTLSSQNRVDIFLLQKTIYNEIAIGKKDEWDYVASSQLNRLLLPPHMFDKNKDSKLTLEEILSKDFYGFENPVVINNYYDYKKWNEIVEFSTQKIIDFIEHKEVRCNGQVFYQTKKSLLNRDPQKVFTKYYEIKEIPVPDYFYHRFFQFSKNFFEEGK